MRDAYERFFSGGYIRKEEFFEFGVSETIYAPYEVAELRWEELKLRVRSNRTAFIRGFGRDAHGTHLYLALYEGLFGNTHIKKDPTNNSEPAKLIRDLTGYSKTPKNGLEQIRNYQISHVFGRTKNVLAFTAPWNIVYVPKLLDPFTGHEAQGTAVTEFSKMFREKSYRKFEKLIEDFNAIVSSSKFISDLEVCMERLKLSVDVSDVIFAKFAESVSAEFQPIDVHM